MHHIDTYQQDAPPAPPAPAPVAPVVININLGEILAGLGLKDLIQAIIDKAANPPRFQTGESITEQLERAKFPKVPRRKLIEAVSRGADSTEVAGLMLTLAKLGALE